MEDKTAGENVKIEYDNRNLLGETVVIRLDEDFTVLSGSPEFFLSYGKEERFQEDGGYSLYDEDRGWVMDMFYEKAANGDSVSAEFRLKTACNSIRWVHCEGKKTGEEKGYPIYQFVVFDVTEQIQKQLEYRLAAESSVDVLFEYLPEKDTLTSHESQKMGGREYTIQGYMQNLKGLKIVHPDDQKLVEDMMNGRINSAQIRIRYPEEDSYTWTLMQGDALRENGRVQKVIGTLKNISDEMARAQELKKLERESQIMAASILTMYGELIVLDLKTRKYMVHKADDSTQATLETTQAADFAEDNRKYAMALIHPEDRQRFFDFFNLDFMKEQIDLGQRKFFTQVRRKNGAGEYRWCEMIGTAIKNHENDEYNILLTFRDIDELRQAKQEKEQAEHRFISAVNAFYDAIYEYELHTGEIQVWKDIPSDEKPMITKLIKNGVMDERQYGIHPDYYQEFDEKLGRKSLIHFFETGQESVSSETLYLCEDGAYRWYDTQIQLLDRDAQKTRVMVCFKNVDDVRKEEERKKEVLRGALALAEESNNAKSDFLSRMSHDIRTPMNAIIGMTAIAEASVDDPGQVRNCLRKIHESADFLLALINDVLDMSKIESGKMNIVAEPFWIRQLIRGAADMCREQSEQKKQRLLCETGSGTDHCYLGDTLRLNQILMNLLTNAVKYTGEGGTVRVSAERIREGRKADVIRIRVEDNGIGISEEFQKKIFQPFEQEDAGAGRVFEGSGLGLSITQNLVHLMNGQISLTSRLGEGSCFDVTLPMLKAEEEEKIPEDGETETKENFHFRGEKILIVEDNELNREIAVTLLEMAGLETETAVDGKDAVDKYTDSDIGYYQAVLMDIRMPVMDGLEAVRRIRNLKREDAAVPVIAMTANAFRDEQLQAEKAGMTAYLTKPVEARVLYKVLWKCLGY